MKNRLKYSLIVGGIILVLMTLSVLISLPFRDEPLWVWPIELPPNALILSATVLAVGYTLLLIVAGIIRYFRRLLAAVEKLADERKT